MWPYPLQYAVFLSIDCILLQCMCLYQVDYGQQVHASLIMYYTATLKPSLRAT
ncbi:hypothetical protein PVAP13_9NG815985 [Panicum virgatum]|uniref:Uncharacterized protein n=1 Tax=Panicum virgatum TaxID=38727 RepID=A0A8T0MZD7_PANVG|nr:hypothetical protein PVAP13_9NG815985 [Panicum virgatum]